MRGIPVKSEKEINSIIWDFIWDGKTNQISRNVFEYIDVSQYLPITFHLSNSECIILCIHVTCFASLIGYGIEMRGIPVKSEKEINSIIWDFIWDGKTNHFYLIYFF
jgi:hypothetical protein